MRHVRGLERGFDWYFHPLGEMRNPLIGESIRARWLPRVFAKQGCEKTCNADVVNAHVLRFLDTCDSGPCFVAANYMEAHAPYCPSQGFAGRWSSKEAPVSLEAPAILLDSPDVIRTKSDLYDEEIAELDAAIGRLLDALERRGILDRAWVVITSDHGEAFGEHGLTEHGSNLYSETTRIPLVVQPPRGEVVPPSEQAVGLLDVATTLAAVAGEELAGGRDLRRPEDHALPVQIQFFGDTRKAGEHGALAAEPGAAVISNRHKLLLHGTRREVYDLSADPAEVTNLAPMQARELAELLPPMQPREVKRAGASLDAEEEERLRALGYVE
jgi:arylsulfatase